MPLAYRTGAVGTVMLEPMLPGAEVMIVAHGPKGDSLFSGTPFVPAMAG